MTTRLLKTALSRRLHRMRSAGRDAGFTILEIMVAFTIFTAICASATVAVVNALNAAHGNQQRIDAANVAQSILAQTQALAEAQRNGTTSSTATVRQSETFVWQRTIQFGGTATQCSPGASFTVHLLVYQQQTNKFMARTDSVIAC